MTEKETWEAAAEQVRDWMRLHIKAHAQGGFTYPEEALREHKNTLNLLGTILSQFRKKAGHDSKEVFKELVMWSGECEYGCKGAGPHYHDDRAMIATGSQPAEEEKK